MNLEQEIIRELRKGIIPKLFSEGYSPKGIKDEIIKSLTIYFKNKNVLREYAIELLVTDWINLKSYIDHFPNLEKNILKWKHICDESLVRNRQLTIEILLEHMINHNKASNVFWTIVKEQHFDDISNFNNRINKKMNFIGQTLEGIIKAFMYELYMLCRIAKGKVFNFSEALEDDFGVVSNFFYEKDKKMFSLHSIRIADWRNIAYHYDYIIKKDGSIICEYGNKKNRKAITINESDLDTVLNKISEIKNVLNFVHKFFFYDNLVAIREAYRDKKSLNEGIDEREEVEALLLFCSIFSQGYEITHFEYNSQVTNINMAEMCKDEKIALRKEFLKLVLFRIWEYTNSKFITINYSSESTYRLSATANNCKKLKRKELSSSQFIDRVKESII